MPWVHRDRGLPADGHRHDEPIGSVDGSGSTAGRIWIRRVSSAKAIGVVTPPWTPMTRLGRLPDASRTIVGTGANYDLLPMGEALKLANDVGTSRIIVHTA